MVSVCLAAWSATSLVQGAFVNPTWTRPASDGQATSDLTTYQSWDVFTSVAGPNAPDVAEVNPQGVANAYDSGSPASGSFLTGGGNIYSFSAVIKPRAIVPGYDVTGPTKFLVQVRTQGQEIDVDDLTLGGVAIDSLDDYSYVELSRVDLGGFGGFAIDHAWAFTSPGDAASFQLDWGWAVSSASLDVLSIDTQAMAVPEPAGVCLLAIGLVGLASTRLARRRRRGASNASRQ